MARINLKLNEGFYHIDPSNLSSIVPLIEKIKSAKYVLIGEATHGTSEFYVWRAIISRYLIEYEGFSFVAVEGDWPDCYEINRYVKGNAQINDSAYDTLISFERWPTWMWANWEVVAFVEWLKRHNRSHAAKVGFYGLDVYSLQQSLEGIINYLRNRDKNAYELAKKAYYCFESIGRGGQEYGLGTRFIQRDCQEEVLKLLTKLHHDLRSTNKEELLNIRQNGLVLKNAEHYYRAMIEGGPLSWNIRDSHMFETLESLMDYHGPQAKAIVWEHNTHIGDARATDMAAEGMYNIGQLVREHYPEETVLIGFGTYDGSVIAGREWGSPMEKITVPPAKVGSWEDVLVNSFNGLDVMIPNLSSHPEFNQVRGHRAIGVVYHPEYEHLGNYVPTNLAERYDAFIFINHTTALHPLHMQSQRKPPEFYPWGFD